MIPVLCTWHEHHERATREIERRLDCGEKLIVAAPGLIEAYAVLTRLPPRRCPGLPLSHAWERGLGGEGAS
jgi:hypothetical protein